MNICVISYLKDCTEYYDYFKNSCEKLKSGQNVINYVCPGSKTYGMYCSPELSTDSISQAMALSIGVDLAYDDFIKVDVFIIADSDVCILYKDWDLHILQTLTQYDIYGFNGNSRICVNFPCLFFMAFNRSVLDRIKLNFFPSYFLGKDGFTHINSIDISTPEMEVATALKKDSKIKCDTGWQIPIQCRSAGIKYNYLTHVSARSDKAKLKINKEFCEKYHRHYDEWHYNNELFGTHCQASRAFAFDSEHTMHWRNKIDAYTQERYGFII